MVKSLEEYPDELLDRIIALAMAYDTVPGDPFVFTTSSAKVATDETRRNIRLVNHRWNAIAKPYMYRDIHFGWRPRVDEYETQNSDLKRFRRLCEFVSSNGPDRLTKTHTLAVFCPAEHPRTTAEMGALLCHLLSHVTLHHFAGTFDHSIPWFPYLRRSSAHTLTHLDLEIHPFIIRSSWVDHLNSMVNLKFLRLSEQRRSWVSFHQDLDEMFSSDDLPNLSLPRLTSLQLFAHYPRADMMGLEGDRIPFLLAKTAELPALTDLRLQGDFLDLGEESVIPFVAAFGSQLRTLYVQLPRGGQLRYIDLAGALPQLTHLSLIHTVPEARSSFQATHHITFYAIPVVHPTLQTLTVSGLGLGQPLLRLVDPASLPKLGYIKLDGVSWNLPQIPIISSAVGGYETGVLQDIGAAVELESKGIPLLDENGTAFGGLTNHRTI